MTAARIAIVGAGVAGLTAAFRLRSLRPLLIEASGRLGGQVSTELSEGFVIERGAEGFVARSQAIPALVADLGMPDSELIDQATLHSYGYDGAELLGLRPGEAAGFLGFQVAQQDLGRGIRSLRRGMGSLVSSLAGNLDGQAELRLGVRALAIEAAGSELQLRLHDGRQTELIRVDAVIVAIPARPAADLLEPLAGEVASALRGAVTNSSITVELTYAREAIEHPLDGSGFVVKTPDALGGLRACTFSASKFEARAPMGSAALRLFFRPEPGSEDLEDAGWIERARAAAERVLTIRQPPRRGWVSRWPDALPVFDPGHRARVAALEAQLQPHSVLLAGSAFHGSGLDAAVVSAERAAAQLLSRA